MATFVSDAIASEIQAKIRLWPYVVFGAYLLYYILWTVRAYWRLRHIPGPLPAILTDWWWIYNAISGKGHLALSEVSTKYGKAISIRVLPQVLMWKYQRPSCADGPEPGPHM